VMDGNPIFITRDRRRVVLIAFSFQEDANRPVDLSLASQHFGAEGFAQVVWQDAPQRMAWLRRNTGDLAAMIYDPTEEILGWATVPVADGHVEAICITPDATGTRDVLTMIVRRQHGTTTRRHVEELAQTFGALTGTEPIAEAVHFYCAISHAGDAQDTFDLSHLIGRDVHAWTSQGEYGPLTVPEDGQLVLPLAVTRACIGLFDGTHAAETLPITASAPEGSAMGRRQRLQNGVQIGLHRTAQGQLRIVSRGLGQPDLIGNPAWLVKRPIASSLTTAFTGVAKIDITSGHAGEVSLQVLPFSGAPLTVTALVPTIQEAGR
jgi:hypothetical protein